MSITPKQASDLLRANYMIRETDDPEWWIEAMASLMQDYPSVKALRREDPSWIVPPWWPGAKPATERSP